MAAKNIITLAVLLLLAPAMVSAQHKFQTSLINPGADPKPCSSAAGKIQDAIREQPFPGDFELLVICDASFWPKVVKAANLPSDTLAFTTLYSDRNRLSRLVIDARIAGSPWLSLTVKHELHHIGCRCQDGD